jgi:hypothetical protein
MWDDKGHLALDGWRLKDRLKDRLVGREPSAVEQADGQVRWVGKGPLASEGWGYPVLRAKILDVVRQLQRLQLLLHDE